MFFRLLNFSVANSFFLYNLNSLNMGKKLVEAKRLREKVIKGLVGDTRNRESRKRGCPGSADHEEQLNWITPHFINLTTNKKTKECMVSSDRKAGNRRENCIFL